MAFGGDDDDDDDDDDDANAYDDLINVSLTFFLPFLALLALHFAID